MPRPRTDIRPRIIKAARAAFADTGVDGASLRSIAREAHTSIGMIYYYFQTKDELFFAVVEEIYVGLLHDMEAALKSDASFEGQVRALYQRLAAATDLELQTVRLVVREAITSATRLERLIDRFKRGHIPLVVQTVMMAMQRSELRQGVHPLVIMIATIVLGSFPQFMMRAAGDKAPITPPEDLTEQLLSVLLHGVAPAPPSTSS